ncbi:MAG: beta-galactosidase [Prevotellaceae bacterium]|nr:beta-galactosidase [Prevotellaceae bacterium]
MKSFFIAMFITACSVITGGAQTFTFGTKTDPSGNTFEVDSKGFVINGRHTLPVMGEIHYARVPEKEWQREIRKIKAGGVTVIATYCFWIHHEPVEGQWNWSGNRNLHRFLQVCKEEGMPVVLRVGPFCHGEVYQGGFPVWLVRKAQQDAKIYKLRSTAPGFMAAVQRLYSNIYAQANDMLWKHGGPVVGVQIENECRGPWQYYMALKNMAVSVGFDTPFYTRTGWPKLNGREEFGKLLPLYGDYADGFWDRKLTDMPGDYPKAFIMKDTRISGVIANETFGTNQDTKMEKADLQYPYLTCELGGGMMQAYHRRINMSGNEAMPLAICKLGSGSNLPGYYMYHGGTNPYCSEHTMAETLNSPVTNYNDMPVMSYDFQCPLGEMGQPQYNAFHQTRLLHQFLADWGEELVMMDVDTLSEHYARRGCFEFYNDYVRILNEQGTAYVRPVNMPWHGHSVTADAQPFCHVGDTLYFIPIKGMKPVVKIDGRSYRAKLNKSFKVKDVVVCVLSMDMARRAYKIDDALYYAVNDGGILYKNGERIVEEYWKDTDSSVSYILKRKAGKPRDVKLGAQKVAAMPVDDDFKEAEVYAVDVAAISDTGDADDLFLSIDYQGDCARVYADGRLVQDNFWNGKSMLVRLSDLVGKTVELRILPLRKDAPIYLQKEQRAVLDAADGTALLRLNGIKVIKRSTL